MFAAFLPLLAAATAAEPARTDLAMLKSFKAACQNVRNFESMDRDARKAGWKAVAEDVDPNLALLVGGGRKAVLTREPDAKLAGSQYQRSIEGRRLFLVISRYEDKDGVWSNGCRLYDFAATGPVPLPTLIKWMKRPNSGTQPLPDNQLKYLWEPGWKSGHSVEASFSTGADPVIATIRSQRHGFEGSGHRRILNVNFCK